MADLKILSVNCQGLNNKNKLQDVLSFLKNKACNIYCLQDTHFTNSCEKDIYNVWGYQCFFSSYRSNSRGVAILFNNNFDFKVLRHKSDNNGNLLAIEMEVENKKITLITIYGPNKDSPEFYNILQDTIEYFDNDYYIICGDFNLILNPDLDCYRYLHINNPKSRERLLEIIENNHLIDAYRELHPDIRRYTWRKTNPLKQARLDLILISESLLSSLQSSSIELSYRSDHSAVYINLKLNDFFRGKGLWKFNTSLLSDMNYLQLINSTINETINQYALPVYNTDNIHLLNNFEIQFIINDQLFLETLLMQIRGKAISYSSYKKKTIDNNEKQSITEIKELEKSLDDQNITELENKKSELQEIREVKLQGKIIRSRAEWILKGEKPTKYFCQLENHNFVNKIIPKIIKDDGTIISKQKHILKEVETFYKNLYSANSNMEDVDLNDYLNNCNIPKLTKKESDNLEGLITYDEASNTLKNMKNDKSPGSDGFPAEFFKCFWKKLGFFVVRSINYGYLHDELSVTQKHGIITCLPKGDKQKQYRKNRRPLTLLNTM